MNDIDLNIDNYSFADVLKLFHLDDKNFGERELIRCKDVVAKLHPSKSALHVSYYDLFNNAYNILETKYSAMMSADVLQHVHVEDSVVINKINNYKNVPYSIYDDTAAITHNKNPAPDNSHYAPQSISTRMVTIHTEDRDVLKYPFENSFEIVLPTVLKNTMSVELFDIVLPTFYYNVSDYFQNTKLWFSIPLYFADPVEISIPSGCYAAEDISTVIGNKLNEATSTKLRNLGVYVSPASQYIHFTVSYSTIERKFAFHNTQSTFILWFDKQSTYENGQMQFDCWKMLKNWGLGYNLGFYKNGYEAEIDVGITASGTGPSVSNTYHIVSTNIADFSTFTTIYMEMDTFNWIDEIRPYSIGTTDFYNNDFTGHVNNAFAKLHLTSSSSDGLNAKYVPVEKFKRVLPHVIEKIGRLKFKFRYHNGIPVDFNHQSFNFSLKFECRFNCSTGRRTEQ
jgi:hypothetical protein